MIGSPFECGLGSAPASLETPKGCLCPLRTFQGKFRKPTQWIVIFVGDRTQERKGLIVESVRLFVESFREKQSSVVQLRESDFRMPGTVERAHRLHIGYPQWKCVVVDRGL